ncbi:SWIM zinc finger family protein [Streptomyces sp. NPDC058171]
MTETTRIRAADPATEPEHERAAELPRPSEAARRALHAARRSRATDPPTGATGATGAPTGEPAPPTPVAPHATDRPGDVARRALRTARARRAVERSADPPAGGPPEATSADAAEDTAGDVPKQTPNPTPPPAAPPPPTPTPSPPDLSAPVPADPAPADPPADVPIAATWWGGAWVRALEEGGLDTGRLRRGREYAATGRVGAVSVAPGRILAYVHGSRPRPYRTQLRLRTLTDEQWDAFLDAAVEHPGHLAALLDKDMPHSLAECADLLPGPGDLDPSCGCPDSGSPCKHAAALCYETARLLDADPFVLLHLRGRAEDDLLSELTRRSAARSARDDTGPAPFPGVRARTALAPRTLPALPPPLPVPAHPEQPPAHPAAADGPDPFALDQLATDAAARAHALLTTGRDPVAGLTLWQDAVRVAAARPGSGLTATTRTLYASLAAATGRTPAELGRAVAAWRQGGPAALTVLEEPWDPPAGRFDRARPALLAAGLPAFRPARNHLTHPRGHLQLRLGQGGLWYAYESEPGHDDWWPRGNAAPDPVGALAGLVGTA